MPIENAGPCAVSFVKETSMDVPLFLNKGVDDGCGRTT